MLKHLHVNPQMLILKLIVWISAFLAAFWDVLITGGNVVWRFVGVVIFNLLGHTFGQLLVQGDIVQLLLKICKIWPCVWNSVCVVGATVKVVCFHNQVIGTAVFLHHK